MNDLARGVRQEIGKDVVKISTDEQAARSCEQEALVRLLGLSSPDLAFTLPAKLPPLPSALESPVEIEVEAIKCRVDLEIARREVTALTNSLSLTEVTRCVSMLQLTGSFNYESPAKCALGQRGRSTCRR